MRTPPAYPVPWHIVAPDGREVLVEAQTYFEARARASLLLQTDPQSLRPADEP